MEQRGALVYPFCLCELDQAIQLEASGLASIGACERGREEGVA